MRFLCDVHISHKVVAHIKQLGHYAEHVNDILNSSETKDADICRYADEHDLIVVTEDADFRDSYFIKNTPKKLIKVNLGNIPNQELINLLTNTIQHFQKLELAPVFLIEIDKHSVRVVGL